MKRHWKMYFFLYLAQVAFGFWIYSVLAWFPTLLMRTYGVGSEPVALGYGLVFTVAGMAGALSVNPLVKKLVTAGVQDAPVFLSMLAMLVMLLPAIAAPLAPTLTICLGLFIVCMYCWAITTTVSYTCIAWVTPSRMTGVVTAFYMVVMNISGGSVAAIVVGYLSDTVFGPDNIRYSFVVMTVIAIPLAAMCFGFLRPLYKNALEAFQLLKAKD